MHALDFESFHFLRPGWLLALVPAVLCGWLWMRGQRFASDWQSEIDPELLEVLMDGSTTSKSRTRGWWFALLLSLGCFGLAGPTWERLPQPVEQKQDALVIVLDLSLSMFAEDTKPSRIIRAKQKITDVLDRRNEGYSALVAYAGDAHIVSPLTDDSNTIQNLLVALNPAMMPVLGSNLEAALTIAHELFTNANITQGRILLVTDGIDNINDATRFASPLYPLSILAVGTKSGARVELGFANQPGRFLQDQTGEFVVAKLDESRLESIVDLTHGRYASVALSDSDLDYLLGTPLPQEDETIEVDREFDTWRDVGYWFVIALLPLMLLTFRRGLFAGFALVVVLAQPVPAQAGWWDDLWQRRDQQAIESLRSGEPERAGALFESELWRGIAKYRSSSFDEAAAAFSADPSATGHFNRGNSLAKLGQYQAAIDAYDRTLALAVDHDDAAFNKALVEKLLEQEQEQDSGNDNQQNQDQDSNTDQQPSSQDQSESQDSDAQQQPEEGEENPNDQPSDQQSQEQSKPEAGENEEEQEAQEQLAERDENTEAMEQWLRRVPDDPGGLLRRKFKFETNQRLRRGEYQEENAKIW